MKKLMTLCIVLTAVAFLAAPAFAEVQNVKVSGDIDSKMIYRADYDFLADDTGEGTSVKDNDVWFMTTTRVRIDADLTDNVSTTVRVVNERDWDEEYADAIDSGNVSDGARTDIDLDLAYVTLKECFYSPLTVTIGRQNLLFGNALVVGDPTTNDSEGVARLAADDLSTIKAFDAIRATLDYSPIVVDLIYSKIDAQVQLVATTAGTAQPRDDMDLWGVNVAYDFDNEYNAAVEGYFFSRRDRRGVINTTEVGGADVCDVFGVNGNLAPVDGLLLSGEVAIQRGDYLDIQSTTPDRIIDRDAWALDLALAYDGLSDSVSFLPGLSLRTAYAYRSGQTSDGATTDDDFSTTVTEVNAWDPMFEDQTHGMIANRIFDGLNDGVDSNGRTICVGASAEPIEDLTVSVDYYNFRLAEAWYSTNAVGASNARTLNGGSSAAYYVKDDKDLGDEVDIVLDYAYTEDVTMSLATGWFIPGAAFDNSLDSATPTNNDTATEVIASVAVAF
ncbi:MAG: alginate export family protein [Candidatus Gorgyraea atricola]|nr:alginate export family protein [Candidatus Gorgyraea atricola]